MTNPRTPSGATSGDGPIQFRLRSLFFAVTVFAGMLWLARALGTWGWVAFAILVIIGAMLLVQTILIVAFTSSVAARRDETGEIGLPPAQNDPPAAATRQGSAAGDASTLDGRVG